MAGILVFGDINVDLLARLDSEPGWGLDNLVPEMAQQCGGVGANVAVALARWNATSRLVGCAGRDLFGEQALHCLAAEGVDTSFVQRTERASTGLIFIPISPGGQRTIFGSRGANALVERPTPKCLEGIAAVHLVGYSFLSPSGADAAWYLLDEAHRRGARVSLDPGVDPSRRVGGILLQVARKVDILLAGLSEASALTHQQDSAAACEALRDCGAKEIVVKLGEKGSRIAGEEGWCDVPAFPSECRDATGAGDAFAATYLWARMRDWPGRDAALLANAAGAAAASVLGACQAMPRPEDTLARMESCKLQDAWEHARVRIVELLRNEFAQMGAGLSGGKHGTSA